MNFPNFLSLSRIPLASLLFISNPFFRLLLIFTACITDVADGYLARKWKLESKLGTILDPFTDKFFAFTALLVLYTEGSLNTLEALLFLSREGALTLFTLVLLVQRKWKNYEIRSFYAGKLMTSLQFIAFLILFFGYPLPLFFYWAFGILGIASFLELIIRDRFQIQD